VGAVHAERRRDGEPTLSLRPLAFRAHWWQASAKRKAG
jgi:hypothetical protein